MDAIILQGVKTHNLKNFDLVLNHRKFYVLTGVSGSGKSSLAFDTLYAEGQRRFVESLSSYARQFLERMERPDVESVSGIPPAIAIQAKNVITNARSTVGTQTEINDYLRLLYARVGKTICPDCDEAAVSSQPQSVAQFLTARLAKRKVLICFDVPMAKNTQRYLKEFMPELERQGFVEFYDLGKVVGAETLLRRKKKRNNVRVVVDQLEPESRQRKRLLDSLEQAFRFGRGQISVISAGKELKFSERLTCPSCGKEFREPSPNLFSFNSPLGACKTCQGFGRVITVDWDLVIPDAGKSLAQGAIEPWTKPSASWEAKQLAQFCKRKKIPTNIPWKKLAKKYRDWIIEGSKAENYYGVKDFFKYLEKKTYKMHVRIFLAKYRAFVPCVDCHETRLKDEAGWVQIKGKTISELQSMNLEVLGAFMESLKLEDHERSRVEPVFVELTRRIRFLNEVGLGYLSLARLSRTLSGGEVQRIHLATSLGSALVDTLYVLDEPSIGLHERDNALLIRLLKELRDLGNTVVVVEHDKTMIEQADEIIDLGPEGGEKGGRIMFQGGLEDLKRSRESLTARYLSRQKTIERKFVPNKAKSPKFISIQGATEHNLKNISVEIPLGQFVVMTGVSGSGKSTLLYDVLYHHYLRYRGKPVQDLGKARSVKGFEGIDDVVLIDQSPIGRTPRSNPATYLKAYDDIRKIFSKTSQARRHGFEAGHFSFNVDGGRCPQCKGDGRIKVEMHFLADVFVPCEVCHTKRFKPEILDVYFEGKNIDDVLGMTIEEAIAFFGAYEKLVLKLKTLQQVGLGYLRLGQSATTLSGGEAQRMKLAYEMLEKASSHTLYLFDEPTTGLHYHDIHYLMQSLEELLARQHSLLIIEHNMEMIRNADYIIDLGPEGGEKGGEVVYSGRRENIMKCSKSYTGKYLSRYCDEKRMISKAPL